MYTYVDRVSVYIVFICILEHPVCGLPFSRMLVGILSEFCLHAVQIFLRWMFSLFVQRDAINTNCFYAKRQNDRLCKIYIPSLVHHRYRDGGVGQKRGCSGSKNRVH